ncbi:MAG: hypothetical protein E4H41_01345 [Gemmatimonadales bacterium]|nr:MAG: hypothetical protein E4H41_01345 [Gemmatimonadales bacterium]
MADRSQNYSNHARYVPGFHFVLAALLLVILGAQIYHLAVRPSLGTLLGLAYALVLFFMFWYMRAFAVTVQDRVIRLEERLRMASLLSAEMQPRINDFAPQQLVALRFASDAELPALAKRVLDEKLTDQKVIKAMIKDWRADYLRA